eukprot:2289267-Pyramimonas_sp.AAC.1
MPRRPRTALPSLMLPQSARCANFDQSSLMIVLCVGVALAQVESGPLRLSSPTTLQCPRATD